LTTVSLPFNPNRRQRTGGFGWPAIRLESGNNHQRRRLARRAYLPKAHYDPRGLRLLPPDLGPFSLWRRANWLKANGSSSKHERRAQVGRRAAPLVRVRLSGCHVPTDRGTARPVDFRPAFRETILGGSRSTPEIEAA
jgi:hypothetical protein